MERYQRQTALEEIGTEGQEKLLRSKVLIAGMGALGCMCASLLARAGVGYIRIIDGDTVDLNNLHRQSLYTEQDAKLALPKVLAAQKHLQEANSEIIIDPVNAWLDEDSIEAAVQDMDLVLDALDRLRPRYLINRFCTERGIPWIYTGISKTEGMTANFLPGGPCFCCFTGKYHADDVRSRSSGSMPGILNTIPAIMATCEATEAIKILTGSDSIRKDLLYINIWENEFQTLKLEKDPCCPVCSRISLP